MRLLALIASTIVVAGCAVSSPKPPGADPSDPRVIREAQRRTLHEHVFLGMEMSRPIDTKGYLLKEHVEGAGDVWTANLGAETPFPLRTIKTDAQGTLIEFIAIQKAATESEADALYK